MLCCVGRFIFILFSEGAEKGRKLREPFYLQELWVVVTLRHGTRNSCSPPAPLPEVNRVQDKDIYDWSSNSIALLLFLSSANHWRFFRIAIHTQDHLSCHHHGCVHSKGASWHYCSRSRSKRWKGPIWGQPRLRYSTAHYPWVATHTETILWGNEEESHRLAPDPHRKHCGKALP